MENLQVPRSAFTFNAPKPTSSPMNPARSKYVRPYRASGRPWNDANSQFGSTYPAWSSSGPGPLPQVPSSTQGPYPPSTIGSDMYQKLPISSGSGFNNETSELPLQTTMPQPVPMGLISEEQQQQQPPPLRSQYTYVQSTPGPRHLPLGASSQPPAENAVNVPRYVEDGRPSKTPRTATHQTAHSSSSIATSEAPAEYRYGSYAPVSNGGGEVGQPSYVTETSAAHPAPSRELYQSPQTWTTSGAEPSSTVAYAGPDGRSYAYDQYKSRPSSGPQLKTGGQTSHPESFSGGHRGSFDNMNNYSWGNS